MGRILIVDDERENIDLLQQFLASEGHTFQTADDADGAMHRLRAWRPQVILLDVNLAGSSSLDLLPKIRAASPDDHVSVILVSGNQSVEDVTQGLDAGADDYLTKPFRAQELISRVRGMLKFKETMDSLRRANHRIDELVTTEPVSGLYNLPTFTRKAEEEILRARRFRKPVSLLAVNLDGFRSVNETGGFAFGNHVLRETGKRIRNCVRSMDLVARLGTDEFLVLLVETDLAAAEFMAERLRDAIRSTVYKNDKLTAQVTCSIGIAGVNYDQGEQQIEGLLRLALEALRSAKSGGRDQIEIYSFA